MSPVFVNLAICVPIWCKSFLFPAKRNIHIKTSIGYQFFESPAIPDSCFPVYRKELWHGIIKVLLLCEMCDFDTPLWTANQCKDFLVFISICMPVSSKDDVCVLSFCSALILPFRIFPLFYMFFYIWHCWYGIFLHDFQWLLSVTHTCKSFCK